MYGSNRNYALRYRVARFRPFFGHRFDDAKKSYGSRLHAPSLPGRSLRKLTIDVSALMAMPGQEEQFS